jgi:hypothetical protein
MFPFSLIDQLLKTKNSCTPTHNRCSSTDFMRALAPIPAMSISRLDAVMLSGEHGGADLELSAFGRF